MKVEKIKISSRAKAAKKEITVYEGLMGRLLYYLQYRRGTDLL